MKLFKPTCFVALLFLLTCSDKAQPITNTAGTTKAPLSTTSSSTAFPTVHIVKERTPYDVEGFAHTVREYQRYCLKGKQVIEKKGDTPIPDEALEPADKIKKGLVSNIEEIFSNENYARYETMREAAPYAEYSGGSITHCGVKYTERKHTDLEIGCKKYNISYGDKASVELTVAGNKHSCLDMVGIPPVKSKSAPEGELKNVAGGQRCILMPDTTTSSGPKVTAEEMKQLAAKAMAGDANARAEMKARGAQGAKELGARGASDMGRSCFLEQAPYYTPLGNKPVIVAIEAGENMKKRVVELKLVKDSLGPGDMGVWVRSWGFVEEPKSVVVGNVIPPGKLEFPEDAKSFPTRDNTGGKLK